MNQESRYERMPGLLEGILRAVEIPLDEPGRLKLMHDLWLDYCDMTTDTPPIDSTAFIRLLQHEALEIHRRSVAKVGSVFDARSFAKDKLHVG